MISKRDDDRTDRPDLTPTVSQVLRAVDEAAKAAYPPPAPAHAHAGDDQKMSLFWRVFGGTILSIVALVAVTLFNNVSTSLTDLRSELVKANEARASAVNDLRAEIARGADARADLVRKDEFNSRLTTNWTQVQTLQAQGNTQNATLTSLKTELDGLKERLVKQAAEADALRKDLAGLDSLREKVAGLAAADAAGKELVQKLRDDVHRNQAGDQERKDRRDALQKHTEDALKEMAKGVQDCREKLARLEGLVTTPAGPPAPKKTAGE